MSKKSSSFGNIDGLNDAQIRQIINWQDRLGLTPLHVAIRNLNPSQVQKLVMLGADCSLPDVYGDTPLHFAAESGNLEILNIVADASDDLDLQNNEGETPVLLASHAGHIGAVVSLTSMEKHVVPADTGIRDKKGRSVLMHACISGDIDLVRFILVNREGNSQRTSISKIAVNLEDNDGITALMYASMDGHWHLISLLVYSKANIAAKDKNGYTSLHWAAAYGNPATVAALLDCGAGINEKDSKQWTAVMHAVEQDNIETAQLLLESGANPDYTIGLAKSERMHLSICDAVREKIVGDKTRKAVTLNGRLMVSILRTTDLYVDPSSVIDGRGTIYLYAVVQFKANGDPNESQMVAITHAVPVTGRVFEWNEALSLFLREKKIGPDCVLSIELFATRNPEPFTGLYNLDHAAGEDEGSDDEDDEEEELERQQRMDNMYREIQAYELKNQQADEKRDAKEKLDEFNFTDHKRRWNQLVEIRKRLDKYQDRHLPLPPVPESHFPCGSVSFSFSRLREIFRGGVLTRFDRYPRCVDRGKLRFDIEFVPSFVNPSDLREPLVIPTTPKASDIPPIEAPDELFNFTPTEGDVGKFATRATKLAAQCKEHYLRWWSSLGGSRLMGRRKKWDSPRARKGLGQKEALNEDERELVKTVQIIAKTLVVGGDSVRVEI